MSTTDELRAMLDERGVEWTNPNTSLRDEMTSWVANGFDYDAFEVPDGTLVLTAAHQDDLTPEQAIEATLGAGTCHVKAVKKIGDSFGFSLSCGHSMVNPFNDHPDYCPWCGRKVVDE